MTEQDEYISETNKEYQVRQTDEARKRAYADPQTGSDRLFSEAARMKAMEEGDWESKQQEAIARYEEIKQGLPWPKSK